MYSCTIPHTRTVVNSDLRDTVLLIFLNIKFFDTVIVACSRHYQDQEV